MLNWGAFSLISKGCCILAAGPSVAGQGAQLGVAKRSNSLRDWLIPSRAAILVNLQGCGGESGDGAGIVWGQPEKGHGAIEKAALPILSLDFKQQGMLCCRGRP